MRKKHLQLIIASAMFIMLLLSGCGSSQSSATQQGKNSAASKAASETNQSNTITVMVSGKLNPKDASPIESSTEMCLYEMVYEPLVKYGQGGAIKPALAERWNVSDDGTQYTFHLRKDVKFSDGTNFNADSVVSSAKHWDPSSFSSPLTNVEKLDDYTVKLTFQDNCYPVLIELTYPRPYRIASENSFDSKANFVSMIGTGEWMVESYTPEEEVIMVPNPYYYKEKPNIQKIIIKKVTDNESRIMALQSGEADLSLADLPAESKSIIKSSNKLTTLTTKSTMGFFLILNQENTVFQDQNVRLAVNYALDRNSIVKNIFGGNAVVAKGILPATVPYVTGQNSEGYSYSIDKAKELLAKSGYIDSDGDGIVEKDGTPLSLKLVFQSEEYASWKSICEYLQSAAKELGIDIRLEQRDISAYYDAIWKNRDFDMIIYRTYSDSWNPHGFLRSMFYQSEGDTSVCWYNSQLNQYLDEVIKIQDETARQTKYNQIFKLIDNYAPVIPLCYPNKEYVYNTRLKNVAAAPTTYEGIEWQLIAISK
ncbi:nickel ABC transporter substrate-binding protein [Desulfoscipio sp. XC116]|uniref:nickel ABC transporter substrate-binding protein n=1 Tax=Desulfoscipio sp. XC116 TaxID=3144975 RepID=UPI00325B6DC0